MTTTLFTKDEVSRHNKYDDLWIIVNSKVYDLTNFVKDHPAGQSILVRWAGKDASEAFNNVHSEAYLSTFLPPEALKGVVDPDAPVTPPSSAISHRKQHNENTILSMKRTVYGEEHEAYRLRFREFIRREIAPKYDTFCLRGQVPAAVYRKASQEGFYLRGFIDKKHGGCGLKDWRYNAIVAEELEHMDCGGVFFTLGNDMCLSYFDKCCTAAQQQKWLPQIAEGKILAVAMSEPEMGSDLGSLACSVTETKDGFVLNGRKMWISNASIADYIIVAATFDPSLKYKGVSLFVVERGMAGFSVAKRFKKIGKDCQDTCLITLKNVKVPRGNIIGNKGDGFSQLMQNLPKERLSIAVGSLAAARRGLAMTVNYVQGREAFGGRLGDLQHIQITLANLRTEIQVGTVFIDQCIADVSNNGLSTQSASMAKLFATELSNKVADTCLQLFGGYGYLKKSPIGRLFADQRVVKIYGGSNPVMSEIISKGLGFRPQRMTKLKAKL